MSVVVVTGSGATTTTVALAASWPTGVRPLVIEADPAGGCLAAWLGVQRSPGLAELVSLGGGADLAQVTQTSDRNIDLVVAPVRTLEASATVRAALLVVVPAVARAEGSIALLDVGRDRLVRDALAPRASVVLVTHRQHAASPAAAVVGLERLAEQVRDLGGDDRVIVALIGDAPYSQRDVAAYVGVTTCVLADDPFAAAAMAGRPAGARRVASSPLMRSARVLAAEVASRLARIEVPA